MKPQHNDNKKKWILLAVAVLVVGLVCLFIVQQWAARREAQTPGSAVTMRHIIEGRRPPAGPSQEFDWITLVVLLLTLVGFGAIVAVMAFAMGQLLPDAINAPDKPPEEDPEEKDA